MVVTVLLVAALAIYCFLNGLMIAGLLVLLGVVPGYGTLPLLVSAVMLFVAGEPAVAALPFAVIGLNIYLALKQQP